MIYRSLTGRFDGVSALPRASIGGDTPTNVNYRPVTYPNRRSKAMRRDIEFKSEGLTLRGWLYVPDGAKTQVPAVVMAHGFSCLKEMFLDKDAEVFVNDGLAVLVYHNRTSPPPHRHPLPQLHPMAHAPHSHH